MSAAVTVRGFTAADAAAWDAFVEAHPEGTFFHRAGWRTVLEEALGHRTHYLLAEGADGALRGVLPLAEVRSWLFGHTLSSLPFCAYGGVLADGSEVVRRLERAAGHLAARLGVGSLELRLLRPGVGARPTKDLYATFRKPIDPDPDANLKALRGKQRNMVRKGLKSGLTTRTGTLAEFYPIYAESVRNLGTPVFPRRLFAALHAAFPEHTEFLITEHGGMPVAAAMLYFHRDEVCPYYWGGRALARRLAGNDFLCWSVLLRGLERGARVFDFGRSKRDTGSWQWKQHWGFEPQPLHYEYLLVRDRSIPNVSPSNPKYRLFIEAWRRLPLPVAGLLGPPLARNLG